MAEKRGGRTVKKDWIKDAYRNWFNRLDEEVPEEVWEGVADELDIDEVWNNVQTELDRAEVIPWLRWLPRAAAVLLLLISALAAYWYLSPAGQEKQVAGSNAIPRPPAADSRALPDSGSFPSGEAGRAQVIPGHSSSAEQPFPEERGLAGIRQPLEELQVAQDRPDLDLAFLLQPVNAQLKPRLSPPGESTYSAYSAQLYDKDPVTSSGGTTSFIRLQRLGIISAYSNTWMLNRETFSGLQPSTLNTTSFTYSTNIGINAGFLLGGKHRVSAEMYLNSTSGQEYRQYIEASYQRRDIRLDYYKAQLYYQLPVFKGKGDILAGAYASYLKRGREKISDEVQTVERLYHPMDYGIMAGFQFNLPVNSHLILQPGIRINYGLPNIFKGDRYIPQNFLRTHNAAAGLYLGIGYRFPTF